MLNWGDYTHIFFQIQQDNINTGIIPDLNTAIEIEMADTTSNTYGLFGFNHKGVAVDKTVSVKYLKIWSGNTLVRHFVPVPSGMTIGSFQYGKVQ